MGQRQTGTLEIFLDKAYDDGFALLIEMRDFLKEDKAALDATLSHNERVLLSHELTRLTRRLADVMAYLLLRRAVAAGELTHADSLVMAAARLDDDLADEPSGAFRRLPLNVRGMIGRTRRLYSDVQRLKG